MSKTKRRNGTHYTRLLDYLKIHKTITSLQAIRDLGNTRLSATIFELRKDGYDITSTDIPVPNRWGTKTMVSQYELIVNPFNNVSEDESKSVDTWLNKILSK